MSELELLLLLGDNEHREIRECSKRKCNVSHIDHQADAQH
jgi:hypothetical protein